MNSLLCCYFPTKVVFVDDDGGVLKVINSFLDDDVASYDFFTDPYKALDLINSSVPTDFIASNISSSDTRIYEIYKAMYNPRRHAEVSTVIVDFQMPAMNGLEFCERIKNPYIRKILFTGVADEDLAIQAFNKGLIHGYIKKQEPNKAKVINDFIRTSQIAYFKTLTDVLVGSILKEINSTNPNETAFYDSVFIKYFEELIKEHKICEYYLKEPVGGFICLSRKGEVSTLYAFTAETLEDNQINTYATLGEFIDLEDPSYADLIKDIEEDRKTLCYPFYGKGQIEINAHNWKDYVHTLDILEGNQPYYVAYVPHPGLEKALNLYSFEQSQQEK
ncbi:response regulator [Candidatus Odyssella thessalonicensis]|uniref:response regulator n=1 Tax=Candidatus Odyssella thessalonicensis TaxID=84647 RepID=UPI000225B1FB|nr:response regulator [Candidatus Odyssella thessalonicensis]